MGQVYRATDTNLKRQVAIKVLPAASAGKSFNLVLNWFNELTAKATPR